MSADGLKGFFSSENQSTFGNIMTWIAPQTRVLYTPAKLGGLKQLQTLNFKRNLHLTWLVNGRAGTDTGTGVSMGSRTHLTQQGVMHYVLTPVDRWQHYICPMLMLLLM